MPYRAKSLLVGILGIAVCTLPSLSGNAARCRGGTERTIFGQWGVVPAADSKLGAASLRAELISSANTRYTRVLIEQGAASGKAWTLVIRDGKQRVLQTLGPEDFSRRSEILTHRLATNHLIFELTSEDGKFPDLLLRQQIIMPHTVDGLPYYSRKVEGVDDWKALYDPTISFDQRKLGDNVAFLMVGLNEGSQPGTCSGLALPPDLLLTNWHCGPKFNGAGAQLPDAFWGQSICDRTLVDLSWDDDETSREYTCVKVLAKSQDLDYALLRIRPIDSSSAIAPIPLSLKTDDTAVSMVHHPAAAKKVISQNCQIRDPALPSWTKLVPSATFTHRCDSEGGSSGAPMFNTQGELVGLHHLGFEIDEASGSCDNKNKAIWFRYIYDDLKQKAAEGEAAADAKLTGQDLRSVDRLIRH
ncbi:hypothetical protein GOL96_30090 [Sinorhizobium medicae]|nr:hypothetical protein [Sinorhizobium medicae]MDX1237976.1 hypothetical protein [Sinorhizobium medicae]